MNATAERGVNPDPNLRTLEEVREARTSGTPEEINNVTVHTVTSGSVVVGFLDAGEWSACFGLSYRDLTLHDAFSARRIVRVGGQELRQVTGAGGIAASRNKVATAFLDRTDGEYLWFVDTDMGFAPDTVDRLVTAAQATEDCLVIGALCFAGLRRKPPAGTTLYAERFLIQPTVYEWVELSDEAGFRPIVDYPRDAVMPVAATGAACLLIHRTALTEMRDVYGDEWFSPVALPEAGKGRKPRTFSEDMSFFLRLAAVNRRAYVDTGVKTTHEKGFIYLDEETFEAQQRE